MSDLFDRVASSLMPVSVCIVCDMKLDAATCITSKATPREGDASLCLYCGNVAVFGADRKLRQPTEEEAAQIKNDRVIKKALKARAAASRSWAS